MNIFESKLSLMLRQNNKPKVMSSRNTDTFLVSSVECSADKSNSFTFFGRDPIHGLNLPGVVLEKIYY